MVKRKPKKVVKRKVKRLVKKEVKKPVKKKVERIELAKEPVKRELPLGLKAVIAILVAMVGLNIGITIYFGEFSIVAYGILALLMIGTYYLYKRKKIGLILVLAIQAYGVYNTAGVIYAFFKNLMPVNLLWFAYLTIALLPVDLGIIAYLLYKRKLFK